jgi:hypothetical protein
MFTTIAVRVCSATFISLVVAWCVGAEGSFGFDSSSGFSWHALGMTVAFPCFMSEAVMAIRTGNKNWHIGANVLATLCCVLSLAAIVYYKSWSISQMESSSDYTMIMNQSMSMIGMDSYTTTVTGFPYYTMYSVHSWCGVFTLTLMTAQLITGVVRRKVYTVYGVDLGEIHRNIGRATFVCGLATCALGLADMQSSDLAGNGYPPYSTYALMSAGASIVLIPLGVLAFWPLPPALSLPTNIVSS